MCDFDRLVLLLEGRLPLDEGLELFDHLDICEVCFEHVYRIWKEHDHIFRQPGWFASDDSDYIGSADKHHPEYEEAESATGRAAQKRWLSLVSSNLTNIDS